MLSVEVSSGFLASLAPEAAGRLAPFLDQLKGRLISSSLVHVDETSDQVGTKTIWFHVVANDEGTYLFASPTRGRAAPNTAEVLPHFTGVMVHDRLSMYFAYDKATHALCCAVEHGHIFWARARTTSLKRISCVVDVVDTAVTPGSEAPVGCRQHLTGGWPHPSAPGSWPAPLRGSR